MPFQLLFFHQAGYRKERYPKVQLAAVKKKGVPKSDRFSRTEDNEEMHLRDGENCLIGNALVNMV